MMNFLQIPKIHLAPKAINYNMKFCVYLEINKLKGLKVAKEDQMADGHDIQWS